MVHPSGSKVDHLYSQLNKIGVSREEEVAVARFGVRTILLTNKYLFERKPKPMCDICSTELSIQHILLVCPKYNLQRKKLKSYCREENIVFNTEILSEHKVIYDLIKFLREAKLITKF